MKKVIINIGVVLLLVTVNAQAQSKKDLNSKNKEKRSTDNIYKFKSYTQKELIVKAAYTKLNQKLNDSSCPKAILDLEKKEFVNLMKGKIDERA